MHSVIYYILAPDHQRIHHCNFIVVVWWLTFPHWSSAQTTLAFSFVQSEAHTLYFVSLTEIWTWPAHFPSRLIATLSAKKMQAFTSCWVAGQPNIKSEWITELPLSYYWFSRFTCAVQLHATALQTVAGAGSAKHVLAGYIRADCLFTHDRRPPASYFNLQHPAADIARVPHEPHSLVTCTNVNMLKNIVKYLQVAHNDGPDLYLCTSLPHVSGTVVRAPEARHTATGYLSVWGRDTWSSFCRSCPLQASPSRKPWRLYRIRGFRTECRHHLFL